ASDVRFHRALINATGNGPLKLMMYTVIESFIPSTNMLTYGLFERQGAADAHQRILDAIRARNADQAVSLLRDHLTGMREVLTASLKLRADAAAARDASA